MSNPTTSYPLPLIGLLESALLPGEERRFHPPTTQDSTTQALIKDQTERLVTLGITSRIELPSLVSSRWGTECILISASDGLLLRGERRVRIEQVEGRREPYTATVRRDLNDDPKTLDDARIRAQQRALGAAQLLMGIATGAEPGRVDWPEQLDKALTPLLHAVVPERELATLIDLDPDALFPQLAAQLAQHKLARDAIRELEAALRSLIDEPKLDKTTRHTLWSQLVSIQRRLDIYDPMTPDDSSDELVMLQRNLAQAGLPQAARQAAQRELRLLRGTSKSHHDYTVHLRHLRFIADLPWHPEPTPDPDLKAVETHLNAGHHGLDEPKRRVLEYLAVRSLGGQAATTVLCLAGPPGTGKTSIARSIAQALGRKFVRISLGGMHDEAELRGHRLSYVAAAPGRLLEGVARAGSMTAVVLLDELDKVDARAGRSPVGALLEILDPEQNRSFRDNYLGFGYDLSNLFFIATANRLDPIPDPLRERLEIIELDGYTLREKTAITHAHLLPILAREHGLPRPLDASDDLIQTIIEGHTREAGVRQLKQKMASLHRDRALKLVTGADADADPLAPLHPDELQQRLGTPRFRALVRRDALLVGVACGMSVSGQTGGSLLFIEVGRLPHNNGDALRLTGRMGEVMRESAHTALAHLRLASAAPGWPPELALDPEAIKSIFHVHVPDAATAKDGPSAGIALFSGFLSATLGRPLRPDLAMTGELTLTGDVLPVGGVRAKLLAAERAGIATVLLPEENLADVPEEIALQVIPIRHITEALALIFPQNNPKGEP